MLPLVREAVALNIPLGWARRMYLKGRETVRRAEDNRTGKRRPILLVESTKDASAIRYILTYTLTR